MPHKVHTLKITKNPVAIRNLTATTLSIGNNSLQRLPAELLTAGRNLGVTEHKPWTQNLASHVWSPSKLVYRRDYRHCGFLLSLCASTLSTFDGCGKGQFSSSSGRGSARPKQVSHSDHVDAKEHNFLWTLVRRKIRSASMARPSYSWFSEMSQGGAMLTSTMRDNSQPPAIGNKQHWWGASLARCHRYFYSSMAV